MESWSLPVIDISCWIGCKLPASLQEVSEEQVRVAKQWDESFSKYGLAVIVGHNVPESVFQEMQGSSKQFFLNSMEHKLTHHHGSYGNSLGGYTPPGQETVALSTADNEIAEGKQPDPVESFVFNQRSPYFQDIHGEEQDNFFQAAQRYFHLHMQRVLKALHYLSACALKQDPLCYFDQFYDEHLEANQGKGHNGNALRIAHYLSSATLHSSEPSLSRYGAHTDYQGYTILRPDSRDWNTMKYESKGEIYDVQYGGLEIQLKDGRWLPVQVPTALNALVINAGDFLQRWTNDRWLSVLHRVSSPKILNSSSHDVIDVSKLDLSRTAIVFFSGPVENCLIESIANEGSSAPKYEPIRSGEHLQIKLGRTNNSSS